MEQSYGPAAGVWVAARERPGEDEGEGVEITVRQHRVTEIGPAVAHQVGAFEQVGGVAETEGVADLVHCHPAEILGVVPFAVEAGWQVGPHEDVGAAVIAADGVTAEHDPAGGGDVMHDDVGGLGLLPGSELTFDADDVSPVRQPLLGSVRRLVDMPGPPERSRGGPRWRVGLGGPAGELLVQC
jgi:hypothetical protein